MLAREKADSFQKKRKQRRAATVHMLKEYRKPVSHTSSRGRRSTRGTGNMHMLDLLDSSFIFEPLSFCTVNLYIAK